jgi:hypothetical protein
VYKFFLYIFITRKKIRKKKSQISDATSLRRLSQTPPSPASLSRFQFVSLSKSGRRHLQGELSGANPSGIARGTRASPSGIARGTGASPSVGARAERGSSGLQRRVQLKGEPLRRRSGRPRPLRWHWSPRRAPPTVQAAPTCASPISSLACASSADQAPTGADLRTPPPLVLRSQLPH